MTKWFYNKQYKNNRIRIDISPTYFGSLQAIRNIKKYNSSPIVIVILRNQFELILSKYNYCIQNGKFKKSIEDFWKEETNEREEYLYYKYIELWKKNIPNAKYIYVPFNLFKEDKLAFINTILRGINCKELEKKDFTYIEKSINRSGHIPRFYFLFNMIKIAFDLLEKRFNIRIKSKILKNIFFSIFLKKKSQTKVSKKFKMRVNKYYLEDNKKLKSIMDFDINYMKGIWLKILIK